ncbi:hypothetical protein OG783_07095 [Streptomyces jietaisiensis]|uniref:hypothetical protein n=1 Tax=Streptomyces griseoaurantiacus TaxID=68213 RepID=UPI00324B6682
MHTTRPTACTHPDRAVVPESDHRPWYLRLGRERPVMVSGCPEDDCLPGHIEPHDVYCRTHERLLPFSTATPSRKRWFVVNLSRAAVCALFTLAAQTANPLPLTVLAASAGAAVLGLPLRHYVVGRAVAPTLWALACAASALGATTGPAGHRVIGTVALALVVLLWLGWMSATLTDRAADSRSGLSGARSSGRAVGAVASGMAVVPAALLVRLLLARGPSGWFLRLPAVRGWLLVTALGGLAGTILAALLAGALDGWGRVDPRTPRLGLPRRPALLRWEPADRRWPGAPPRSFAGRVKLLVLAYRHQVLTAVFRALSFGANVLRLTGHHCVTGVVRLTNLLVRQAVLLWRRTRMSVLCAGRTLVRGAGALLAAVPRGVRLVLLPPVVLLLAALLVPVVAERTTAFLTEGGPARLGLALLGASGCLALWTVAWAAVTGAPLGPVRDSAVRTAGLALPHVVLLTTVGGWVLGLPGTFGHGRMHVGWLTLTLTALVLVFLIRAKPDRAPVADK